MSELERWAKEVLLFTRKATLRLAENPHGLVAEIRREMLSALDKMADGAQLIIQMEEKKNSK